MDIVSGDDTAGSIKQIVFTKESGLAGGGPQLCRVDYFDPENFAMQQTVIQGLLSEKMESVVSEVRYEAIGTDKCICKVATQYHPKDGSEFKEDDNRLGKHFPHLLFHPTFF
ncbi:hypothetical protein SAY86_014939 [Trapa natans]|uniref:Bet v I/Major latex protein domain-containing protein n=1 Tax=Trapa natans TaxID=22666 RepID=A0AAN7KL44_TRANT|nr:hypothetical protein SAY86_014939 [Trapa natans]